MPRSYQVTPVIPNRRRATQPMEVRPLADTDAKSQLAAGRDNTSTVGRHRPATPDADTQADPTPLSPPGSDTQRCREIRTRLASYEFVPIPFLGLLPAVGAFGLGLAGIIFVLEP